jgi:L-amino acid N-acyltransferase YncA
VIRALEPSDWPAVARVYAAGIAGGDASFETTAPSWEDWDTGHLAHCRLVAEQDGAVVGWAALSPTSGRCVYAGVAEVSVYVDPAVHGRGVGRALLTALVEASEAEGLWTLQAGVFPENTASLALHERCGFRVLGVHERLGRTTEGRWRDVVRLERRSPRA